MYSQQKYTKYFRYIYITYKNDVIFYFKYILRVITCI